MPKLYTTSPGCYSGLTTVQGQGHEEGNVLEARELLVLMRQFDVARAWTFGVHFMQI